MAALSKREKLIAFAVAAAAGIFLLDKVAVSPYFAALDKARVDTDKALKLQADANDLLARKKKLTKMIEEMKTNGLLTDASQAESQANVALLDWARDTRVNITVNNPERPTVEGAFTALNFHVTATGTTAAIARLLYAIESSALPVRVSDVNLKSAKEQTDDLQLQMSFSTLCITGELDRKPKAGSAAGTSGSAAGGSNP